jgi:hypothetical protein
MVNWYRPQGMGYVVYVPMNLHRGCDHPYVNNCTSVIVTRSNGGWRWQRRIASTVVQSSDTTFRTQAEAKHAVEVTF